MLLLLDTAAQRAAELDALTLVQAQNATTRPSVIIVYTVIAAAVLLSWILVWNWMTGYLIKKFDLENNLASGIALIIWLIITAGGLYVGGY